jgi:hypothetical protein
MDDGDETRIISKIKQGQTRPLHRRQNRLLPGCTTYMGASSTCCPKAGDITPLLRMDALVHLNASAIELVT